MPKRKRNKTKARQQQGNKQNFFLMCAQYLFLTLLKVTFYVLYAMTRFAKVNVDIIYASI